MYFIALETESTTEADTMKWTTSIKSCIHIKVISKMKCSMSCLIFSVYNFTTRKPSDRVSFRKELKMVMLERNAGRLFREKESLIVNIKSLKNYKFQPRSYVSILSHRKRKKMYQYRNVQNPHRNKY